MDYITCPKCGSNLKIIKGQTEMDCPACGRKLPIPQGPELDIEALLAAGNRALSAGVWTAAREPFLEILAAEPKNAPANLGMLLAQEECGDLDTFLQKRKDLYQSPFEKEMIWKPDQTHIDSILNQCRLEGYVNLDTIRALYDHQETYHSRVRGCSLQVREEEMYWDSQMYLLRAMQNAEGELAQTLNGAKESHFAWMHRQVELAKQADTDTQNAFTQAFAPRMEEADQKARELYEAGLARREEDYQRWKTMVLEGSPTREQLAQALAFFTAWPDYDDSEKLSGDTRKFISRLQAEEEKALRKVRNKRRLLAAIAAAVVAVGIAIPTLIVPQIRYSDAEGLLHAGVYLQARDIFLELKGFRRSEQAEKYALGHHLLMCAADPAQGDLALLEMLEIVPHLSDEDSVDQQVPLKAAYLEGALEQFQAAGNYWDSAAMAETAREDLTQLQDLQFGKAQRLLRNGDFRKAAAHFDTLGDYQDSLRYADYARANYFMDCAAEGSDEGLDLLEDLKISVDDYAAELLLADHVKLSALTAEMKNAALEKEDDAVSWLLEQGYTTDVQLAKLAYRLYQGQAAPELPRFSPEECRMFAYWEGAQTLLAELGEFRDSQELDRKCTFLRADAMIEAGIVDHGKTAQAYALLETIADYGPAQQRLEEFRIRQISKIRHNTETGEELARTDNYYDLQGRKMGSSDLGPAYTYNSEGALATEKRDAKTTVSYTYYKSGRLYKEKTAYGTGISGWTQEVIYNEDGTVQEESIDNARYIYDYYYDNQDRVASFWMYQVFENEKFQSKERRGFTSYAYNPEGLMAKEEGEVYGLTSTSRWVRKCTYDQDGNILTDVRQEKRTGQEESRIEYTYTDSGVLQTQKSYENGTLTESLTFRYDNEGRLIQQICNDETIDYSYGYIYAPEAKS